MWRAVRHHWWVVLLVLVPWTLAVSFYVFSQPPRHSAVSVVSIVPDGPESASSDFISVTASRYVMAMTSTDQLRQIAQETGVSTDQLRSSVTVENTAPSANLRVTATFEDPETAESVANAVAEEAVDLGQGADRFTIEEVAPAVLQEPSLSSGRSAPYAVLLLAGVALALWVAVVVQRFRPSVRNEQDLERVTGAPSLMVLDGRVSTPQGSSALPVALRQAQALQLALHHLVTDAVRQVTFVGVGAADGTATAAYLFARTLSAGESVLLVDADVGSATLSGVVGEMSCSPLAEGLETGRPPLPSGVPEVHLLSQSRGARGAGDPEGDAGKWVDLLDGAAQTWDKVVLAAPALDGDGEFQQHPLPSDNAVLVVPRGSSASAVELAARRVRHVHGDLLGAILYRGPADS